MEKVLALGLAIAVSLCFAGPVSAASNQASDGGSTQVRLNFQIQIPTLLHLRVGSAGAVVDTITFNVTDVPGTGAVQSTSSGGNLVPVHVRAFVPAGSTITLSADSSTPLSDRGNSIPFSEISWVATDDFNSGRFNDTANQQLNQFTGSNHKQGTYTFYYDNDRYYPGGTYRGTAIYTLSSP
ncbi:MAG: hypothetical protein JRI46_11840 [Deltaproteobacteria bacterium]|nr:hypothetical protein [Deltaproteobacteria bacterium]